MKLLNTLLLIFFSFNLYAQFIANFTAKNITSCNVANGAITSKISGKGIPPYTFKWSNGATQANISNLNAGTYCVTVTDFTCCSASTCIEVKDESQIPVPLIWEINAASSCSKDDGKLNALFTGSNPAGLTFECFWFRNLNWVSVGKSGPAAPIQWANLAIGDYKIVVTNTSGCTGEQGFKITAPDEIKVSTDGLSPCKGQKNGSIKVNVTPQSNVSYDISIFGPNGQPFIVKNTYSAIYNNIGIGNYTITVHKAGNPDFCTKILQYELKEDVFSASDITATVKNNCNSGDSYGKISLDPYKFGADYKVLWSFNKSTSINQINLASCKYTVEVTNQCGKKATQTFEVKNVGNLTVTQKKDITCGSTLTATLPNGNEPIDYLWSSGGTTQSISNVGSGRHFVTVKDAAGCTFNSGADVPNDPSLYIVTMTEQPCKGISGSGTGVIIITAPNDDAQVYWGKIPIPLTKSSLIPYQTGIINGLNSYESIYLQVKIGNCTLKAQFETGEKNTSVEFVNYDKKTELCETNTVCNGNIITNNKEAPYPGYSHGSWLAECEKDLFCRGKKEKVDTKKYEKETVKLGKYLVILEIALKAGLIDDITYFSRISEVGGEEDLDSYCDKVRYCSAPGPGGFSVWEAPFSGFFNSLPSSKFGTIEATTPGCYKINCPETLKLNDNFCLKDILPDYMQDYFNSNPNITLPITTCTTPRKYPFYQLIKWEGDITSAFPQYLGSPLEKAVEKYRNDPRAYCAFVTFCLDNFSILKLDIEQVKCSVVTVTNTNGNLQDFETCKLDCTSCADPIAYCNNDGSLFKIQFNPKFPDKNNFKTNNPTGSNSLNPLENLKFSSSEPSIIKNFSISRDLDRKVVNGLTEGNDKHLFLDYRYNAYDKRELETPNITHFLDDYTYDFWIATEQVDSSTIALTFEKDSNIDWIKIITAKDYLNIKSLHEEAGTITISGTFNGTLLADGKVVSESSKGGAFILRYNQEGNIVSNNVIENMGNDFIAENLSGNTYLTGISFGELKSDNQQLSADLSSAGTLSQLIYDKNGKIIRTITNTALSKELKLLTTKTSSDGTQTIYVLKGQGDITIKQKTIVKSNNQDDITLISFDNDGNLDWYNSFDGVNVDTKHISLSFGLKNTLYLGLTFKNKFSYKKSFYTSNGKNDVLMMLLDNNGNIVSSKQFGSEDDENISQLMNDEKGVLYFGGEYDGPTQERIIGNHQFINEFKTSFSQSYVSYVLEQDFYIDAIETKSIKNSNNQNSELIAYPNPFTNNISVEINTNEGQNCTLSIQSITGTKVYAQPYVLVKGVNKIDISLDKLLSGIYIIEVKYDSGQILTDRILKMN